MTDLPGQLLLDDLPVVALNCPIDPLQAWAEIERLRAELAAQKAFTLTVAERLAICSWLLSRCAERREE
jgi:uncharacterized small protein (DUF1192 family)